MIDTVSIQNDLFYLLNSEPRLQKVNIVNERQFILLAGIQWDMIWMTPRNGCSGQGILVEMPKLDTLTPNVPAPVYQPTLTFVAIQAADLAFSPTTGGQLFAEMIAQIIVDQLSGLAIDTAGTLYCEGKTIERAKDPEYAGTNAQRITIRGPRGGSKQTPRVPIPTYEIDGNNIVTLACSDADAEIYYTTDETFPAGNGGGNPGSMKYTLPFSVNSGDIIRVAAWRNEGFINSHVKRYVVV